MMRPLRSPTSATPTDVISFEKEERISEKGNLGGVDRGREKGANGRSKNGKTRNGRTRRKRTRVDSVVSVPALFVRPRPTSYLGSRVQRVPCTDSECRSSLAWEEEHRDYGWSVPSTCLGFRLRSWLFSYCITTVYGTVRSPSAKATDRERMWTPAACILR